MADPRTDTEEAREAAAMGEKPDLGHTEDALKKALEGTDMGSDTRAGSLRGGSASGSDIDPDQDVINEALAAAPEGVSDNEVARQVGLAASTLRSITGELRRQRRTQDRP